MGNQNSIPRMSFEDIQCVLKNEAYCLINPEQLYILSGSVRREHR